MADSSTPHMPSTDPEPPPLDADALRARLAGLTLGHPLIYLPAVGSTNTFATELARAGAAEGALVVTDEQTAGRGRVGRVWRTLPRQQVLCSFLLRPPFPPYLLVMAAALAVARTAEDFTGKSPGIKWPNDVLYEGRKLCGILIETGTDSLGRSFAILGTGLNVNGSLVDDPELGARAATLADLAGHTLSREEVAATLAGHLDTLYTSLRAGEEDARRAVREQWRARLVTLGQQVRIIQRDAVIEGLAEDVDEDGTLLLRGADGRLIPVTWGDVS
jgi:BirA family transcriptional regulator, biotin operon repressor / biotin---[acetyl-CoA-carboxylase] ligase